MSATLVDVTADPAVTLQPATGQITPTAGRTTTKADLGTADAIWPARAAPSTALHTSFCYAVPHYPYISSTGGWHWHKNLGPLPKHVVGQNLNTFVQHRLPYVTGRPTGGVDYLTMEVSYALTAGSKTTYHHIWWDTTLKLAETHGRLLIANWTTPGYVVGYWSSLKPATQPSFLIPTNAGGFSMALPPRAKH